MPTFGGLGDDRANSAEATVRDAAVPGLYHRRKQIPAFHRDAGSMPVW